MTHELTPQDLAYEVGRLEELIRLGIRLMRENLPSSKGTELERRMRNWIGQAEVKMR